MCLLITNCRNLRDGNYHSGNPIEILGIRGRGPGGAPKDPRVCGRRDVHVRAWENGEVPGVALRL